MKTEAVSGGGNKDKGINFICESMTIGRRVGREIFVRRGWVGFAALGIYLGKGGGEKIHRREKEREEIKRDEHKPRTDNRADR